MLNKGTKLDPRNLTAAEIAPTISVEVVKRVRSTPFGEHYLGSQGDRKLLLTSFEPDFVADPSTRAQLMDSLSTASSFRHESVLDTYGCIEVSGTLVAVRAHPGSPTLKNFIDRRRSRNKEISPPTAVGIVIEVAHALCALHPNRVHGFLNSETVFLSKRGSVALGGLGEMPLLRSGSILRDAYASGSLPMPPPELRGNAPKPSPASDMFFLGSLFVELLTGSCVTAAGDDMSSLRGLVAPALRDILVTCCASQAASRPADAFEFLDMIARFRAGAAPEAAAPSPHGAPTEAVEDPPSADGFMSLGALSSLDDTPDSGLDAVPAMDEVPTIGDLGAGGGIGLDIPTLDSPGFGGLSGDEPREGISLANMDSSPELRGVATSDVSGVGISLDMVAADVRLVVVVDGIDEGPYELDTIRSKIRTGKIQPHSLVGELGQPPQKATEHPATMNMFATEQDGAVALVSMDPSAPPDLGLGSPAAAPTPDLHTDSIGLDLSGSPAVPLPHSGPSVAATSRGSQLNPSAALETANDAPSAPYQPTPAPTRGGRASRGSSVAGTLGWVILTLVLFTVTAWVMWQRQGSGG